jgi:hypothetical protein
VESAIYTYSDNLPVDIYLNGNIIRKNFPNRTYLVLDPEIITFPNAGPHTLIAVDNRNLGSKTTQSKTQTFQFRVEADKELIVFNVQPNRPFIR